ISRSSIWRVPHVSLNVDYGTASTSGDLSLISIGYGLHQAWIYSSMFDDGSVFGLAPLASGFFNEEISLTYIISILVYGIMLLLAVVFDRFTSRLINNVPFLLGAAIVCSLGTAVLLFPVTSASEIFAIELVSGIATGLGSSMLLLAWGIGFARRDTATIVINGSLAIAIGFTIYAYGLHQLPYPLGGICASIIPLLEVLIIAILHRNRQKNQSFTLMFGDLPIDQAKFALRFGIPVFFLGIALGIIRTTSISGVLTGATASDQSLLFGAAIAAAILLLAILLFVGDRLQWGAYFRPILPIIAVTGLFIPFTSDVNATFSTGVVLMGYMMFEGTMWIFFGQLSQRFRISAVFIFGLGRGLLAMAALGGSLLPIFGSDFVDNSFFGEGMILFVLILVMLLAFALLPDEKEIEHITTFHAKPSAPDSASSVQAQVMDASASHVINGSPETAATKINVEPVNVGAKAAGSVANAPQNAPSQHPAETIQNAFPAGVHESSEARKAMLNNSVGAAAYDDEDEMGPSGSGAGKSKDYDGPSRGGRFRMKCEAVANTYMLSKRETEVMFFLARGFKSSYIQERLYISEGTAKTHIRHIYRKLDIHSQDELMKLVNNTEI
ncbi:MAG: helix-turn-helix transcriptional regulator, partial [Eggerthellaceae bacterium]|nr:helix-turn-helix transcriptional regulator [Eggerthellaceae bacterium]